MHTIRLYLFFMILSLFPFLQYAQNVVQSLGVDASVNYNSLKKFGPWDDRNYELTSEDLKLLSLNEHELRDPIPAFFRVFMRRANPNMRRSGPAQYPRSALQIFRLNFIGYLVNKQYYNKVRVEGDEYEILMNGENVIDDKKNMEKSASSEIRVTSPEGAAESAIKIHPLNPNIVIAGSNGPGLGQKMHYSHDGGTTWTQVSLPLGSTCCDPTVDYSANGQYAYTATLGNCAGSGCAVWFYRSGDNGVTWTDLEKITAGDPRRELTTSGSDKEFLHVDKHCGSPFLDNLYLTWHDNNIMQFAKSIDKGDSWSKTSFSSDPRGIGSDIVTDHLGNIYYVYPAFTTRQIILKKSTDGGNTFQTGTVNIASTQGAFVFPIPSMDTREVFIYTSIDADLSGGLYNGSIYVAWTDSYSSTSQNALNNHSRIQVAYSRDQGASWTTVTPHSTGDQNTVDRYHQWLAVGQDGTVHVVYYDTRNSANRNGVDLYHSSSNDGGQTFSVPVRLTTTLSPKINNSFEFGDYNGLDHVVRQSSIFTDNRKEGGGSGDSEDVYSTTDIANGAVNTSLFPRKPSTILGPTMICAGQENIPFSAPTTINADTYQWSFSDNSVTISGNGGANVVFNGVTTGGTVTLVAQNVCGNSAPTTTQLAIAPTATCSITDCVKNSLFINNDTLSQGDVFDIILTIESDGTIGPNEYKIFRAGESIELKQGFTVESSGLFLAEIENCSSMLKDKE